MASLRSANLARSILSRPSTSRAGAALALGLSQRGNCPYRLPRHRFHIFAPPRAAHFDTHLFVQRLEHNGMTRPQAEGVIVVLSEVIEESVRTMELGLISKEDVEKQRYAQKVDLASLKSELQHSENTDLTSMRAENDRLMADIEKLKQRLREEVTRTQAGVRLDLNLEKGRIRDEASLQELRMKEVDTRIESEIAGLRTQIESTKSSVLQYLIGVVTGSGALLLAYWRLMI